MRLVKTNWLFCLLAGLALASSSAHAGDDKEHKKDKEHTKTEHTKTEEPTVPVTTVPEVPVVTETVPVVTETVTVVEEPVLVLTCAEIGSILIATNLGEVTQGQFALVRALSPLVRSFAFQMVTHHSTATAKVLSALTSAGSFPLENRLSTEISARNTEELALLASVPLLTFDRFYMDQQIIAHQRTLALIDTLVIASADPVSRILLADARVMIADHLAVAVSIRAVL